MTREYSFSSHFIKVQSVRKSKTVFERSPGKNVSKAREMIIGFFGIYVSVKTQNKDDRQNFQPFRINDMKS